MNIPRPEHLEAQYIYRDYGGCIFKLPRNKDLCCQSLELQEYYYWTLAELAYKQLVVSSKPSMAQVANWQVPGDTNSTNGTTSSGSTSRYIQLTEIKKPLRDKLIASALAQVFTNTYAANTNNPFQYVETVS
jgi:hypothetical protein